LTPESQGRVLDEIGAALRDLQQELEKMELRSTARQLSHIKDYVFSGSTSSVTAQELRRNLIELLSRMQDELEAELFLSVSPSRVAYYEQKASLFGDAVAARFPRLTADISEAGKCLALNRSTACVFHLMRVMEVGVQEFGTKLGVQLAAEKNWQNILDETNRPIKALVVSKDPLARAYTEVAAHLFHVKVAWRNEVMHPKETYTDEEAETLFRNVKTFMTDLIQIL